MLNQNQVNQSELAKLLLLDINRPNLLNWDKTKRRWAKTLGQIPKSSEIREALELLDLDNIGLDFKNILNKSLRVKKMRSLSGVVPIALMMKPDPCPGKCTFCVQEKGLPKSYMSDEPSAMRALEYGFDPKAQLLSRLEQLEATGHKPEKLQIIILGGTFSSYGDNYKREFIKQIFDAANKFESRSIEQAHELNESAQYKIIGMSIETRPDWITPKEVELLRDYGVTKVQLGVQALDEQILKNIRREHNLNSVRNATLLLREAGFKINYHFMPNLPGSTPEKDISMCKLMFEDEGFKPDTLKLYPCIVIPKTALYQQYLKKEYESYNDKILGQTLAECKKLVPYYCRIDRLVRDISKNFTASGTKKTNFRQDLEIYLKEQNIICKCIRCREVKDQNNNSKNNNLTLGIKSYDTLGGTEYFLSFENITKNKNNLFAMLRLRLPRPRIKSGVTGVAMIRELQVFGRQVNLGDTCENNNTQHKSLGKKLMLAAEKLAADKRYEKISVISGVGVRGYYRRLGYEIDNTYMSKTLVAPWKTEKNESPVAPNLTATHSDS